MKKMLSIVLVLVLCLALTCPVFAVDDTFVPSIGYKPAPELAPAETEDGPTVGYAYDEDGNVIGSVLYVDDKITVTAAHPEGVAEDHVCLIITPLSEAETSTEIPDAAKDLLLQIYDQLVSNGMKLFGECEGLNEFVAERLGEGITAEDLVVRDLFDVSVLCDELEEYLEPDGTTICLDFDMNLPQDTFVAVVAYKGGQWRMIENVEVGVKGNVVCTTYENFCPVAVLTLAEEDAAATPYTGDTAGTNVMVWGCVMAASLAAILVLFLIQRKRKESK